MNPAEIDQEFFEPSGRFNPYRWHRLPEPTKDLIFTREGLEYLQKKGQDLCSAIPDVAQRKNCKNAMTNLLPKYCRCIPEVASGDVYRFGEVASNPYAICQASISRARSRQDLGIDPHLMRSLMATTSRAGECSSTLELKHVPVSLLYAYAVHHLQTTKGRAAFAGKIPSLDNFLKDRNHWRPLLENLVRQYIQKDK